MSRQVSENMAMATVSAASGERRGSHDRRRRHVRAFFHQFAQARRRIGGRRDREHDIQVDFHAPWLLVVTLVTLALCIVDVYATLIILERGGTELNPAMDALIKKNVWLFFGFKYSVTAVCLAVLLTYRKFKVFRNIGGLQTLYFVLCVYVLLVMYEVKLLLLSSPV